MKNNRPIKKHKKIIFRGIILRVILFFGFVFSKLDLTTDHKSSVIEQTLINNNQTKNNKQNDEKIILEYNDSDSNIKKIILAKSADNSIHISENRAPSSFPTSWSPRPTQNVYPSSKNVNIYRTPPKTVNKGLGKPGGGPGDNNNNPVEFDNSVPKKKDLEKPKNLSREHPIQKGKKNKSGEQCDLEENQCSLNEEKFDPDKKIKIVSKISDIPSLVKEADKLKTDIKCQREINSLTQQLELGNENPGLGTTNIKSLKNVPVQECRGKNGARIYYTRAANNEIHILAKSTKHNQKKIIAILKKNGY